MQASTPLLRSETKTANRNRQIVAAVVSLGVLAVIAAVALLASSTSRSVLLADGVEPVNKLSFAQAEKAHFKAAKKLDDVSSRSAINRYFDSLDKSERTEHKMAEAKSSSKQQSLNAYFDSLGNKYHKEAVAHAKLRAQRHPGKLTKAEKRAKKDIHADEAAVDAAVDEGVEMGETKVGTDSSALSTGAEKIKIGFYMESMCPGCKYFTTKVLKELMAKPDFVKMVDLTVYPYGNGQLSGTSIQCQHGADECVGNKIIACMQSLYPISEASTGFVNAFVCMEGKDGKPKDEAEACLKDNGLDYAKVMTCANSDKGEQLALEAAQATESLVPAHEYAPWVTMNGSPLRDQSYQLQQAVCDAYKGTKPSLCSAKQLASASKQALSTIHSIGFEVCPRRSGKV